MKTMLLLMSHLSFFACGVVLGFYILWAEQHDYVIITVFNPVTEQTDSTPLITADGSKIISLDPQPWIAVSDDLLEEYPMGTRVVIDCDCPYDGEMREVRDRMHPRFSKRIDVLGLVRTGIYAGSIRRL